MSRLMDPIDEQVEHLRMRMELLQKDRSSKIQAIQAQKEANEEEIIAMRESNKQLRVQLSVLKRDKKANESLGTQNLKDLRKGVLKAKSELDTLKVTSLKLKAKLSKLQDRYIACKLETPNSDLIGENGGHTTRDLENKLDKALKKCSEADQIRLTYEEIRDRLCEEKRHFGQELKSLDRILKSKEKDLNDLNALFVSTKKDTGAAQQELANARGSFEANQAMRRKQRIEKERMLQFQLKLIRQQEEAEVERKNKLRKLRNSDFEQQNHEHVTTVTVPTFDDLEELRECEEAVAVYERMLHKLLEVMDLSGPNLILEKLTEQSRSAQNLQFLVKQQQARVDQMAGTKARLESEIDNERIQDQLDLEEQVQDLESKKQEAKSSQSEIESCQQWLASYSTLNLKIKASMKALQARLDSMGERVSSYTNDGLDSNLSLIDALSEIAQILERMQQKKDFFTISKHSSKSLMEGGLRQKQTSFVCLNDDEDFLDADDVDLPEGNTRIQLPSVKGTMATKQVRPQTPFDEEESDNDEEIVSRDKVKRLDIEREAEKERRVKFAKEHPEASLSH